MTLAEVDRLGRVREAAGMRIASVEPVLLSYDYPPGQAPAWSGGTLPGLTAGLVRVSTHDGLYGIGESYAGVFAPEVVRALMHYFRDALVGEDPSDVAGLWRSCASRVLYWGRTGIAMGVLAAIESALWDLCGKALGRPVHELLGGAVHERLPRYASGGTDAEPDALRREQQGHAAAGFLASKIRAGVSPQADLRTATVAREGLGPGVGLAVDAVQGSNPNPWPVATAIEAGRLLEPLGLAWFEEPCAAWDLEGYVACRRALDMPIAGGETFTSVREFAACFEAGAFDLAQPDAAFTGGMLPARRVCALAEEHGVEVAVHAWSSGACVMQNYHVAFASPNAAWLEYPTQANPLIEELMVEPLRVEEGMVLAPTAPGLGVDVTPEQEERYPFKPGNHYRFEERRG